MKYQLKNFEITEKRPSKFAIVLIMTFGENGRQYINLPSLDVRKLSYQAEQK